MSTVEAYRRLWLWIFLLITRRILLLLVYNSNNKRIGDENLNSKNKFGSKSKIILISVAMPLLVAICVYKSNNTYRIDEVSKIIINYLDDKSVVFKNYTLIDKDNIKTVINAMNNKEKLKGKIDIRTPDYSIIIFLTNQTQEQYNLWLGDSTKGLISKDNIVWKLSEKSTVTMKKLLD